MSSTIIVEKYDTESESTFYENAVTGEVAWDKPSESTAHGEGGAPLQTESQDADGYPDTEEPERGDEWMEGYSDKAAGGDQAEIIGAGSINSVSSSEGAWVEKNDEDSGCPFYENIATFEVSWEKPVSLVGAAGLMDENGQHDGRWEGKASRNVCLVPSFWEQH